MQYIQGELFPDFISINLKSDSKTDVQRKRKIHNLHLYNEFPTEGKEDMPLLAPYNGPLPEDFISFSDRGKKIYGCGIHCYLYDYRIEPAWSMAKSVVSCLKHYRCCIAPDFSVFVDQSRAMNVWNIYRNRWLASFWQSENIAVIPSASWGNADSFEYCFDGLPENSIIAIGHIVVGKDKSYKKLYRYGVETLIDRKHPKKLVVYGSPLDFYAGVEVVYYQDMIHKLRQL